MKDAGQVWQKSNGIAFLCFERLCTKCIRRECDGEGTSGSDTVVEVGAVDGKFIVVRYCGSEELKCASWVRQSY
jgi:hypothetical protein